MKFLSPSRFDKWTSAFAVERDALAALFGADALRIDHHGSTSVRGLVAKPIIDIQVSVRSLHPLSPYVDLLATLGYTHVPHPDDAWCPFFHKPSTWPHTHHVHIVEGGSHAERRTLAFRDYLRARPDVRHEYAALKGALAQRYESGELASQDDYAAAKTSFITSATEAALAAGYPLAVIDLPLVTRRLILREIVADDFTAIHQFASDPAVTRHMFHGVRTEDDTRDYVRRTIDAQGVDPRRVWELAIVRRDGGSLIGACDLTLDGDHDGDLGYILRRDAWGHGYATEAAQALVNAGFARLRLDRIYAACEEGHVASARVLEKAGLHRVQALPRHRFAQGRWWDMERFELHRLEWESR